MRGVNPKMMSLSNLPTGIHGPGIGHAAKPTLAAVSLQPQDDPCSFSPFSVEAEHHMVGTAGSCWGL